MLFQEPALAVCFPGLEVAWAAKLREELKKLDENCAWQQLGQEVGFGVTEVLWVKLGEVGWVSVGSLGEVG